MTGSLRGAKLGRRRFLAGLAGGGALFAPAVLRAQPAQTVRLAYGSTNYTWAVPYVAEEAGDWKAQNVDLVASAFESGRDAMQALLTGAADFSASTETPFVFAALNGLRPVTVVNYSRYSRDMKIAVRTDRGIDPQVPASLKGRRIATRVGTSGQFLLSRYLDLAKLKPDDVTVLDIAPGNLPTALSRGDIDGFVWSSQAAAVARRQSGGNVAEMTFDGIEAYFQSHQLLLTTEKVLKARPEAVKAAARALFSAENRIRTDPDWPALIADRVRTPASIIREATSSFTFRIGFDDRFIEDLETQARWAVAAGLGKPYAGDVRALLRGLVADGPTRELHPERVTLS